ncbi:hypothetical protein CYL17_02570 [Thermobispora bispora]|nr:hypothetical protein [Actinomycetales bacterium]QSI46860.1 hypothetical protein CYL17_02570 [Thermobispora bispora]
MPGTVGRSPLAAAAGHAPRAPVRPGRRPRVPGPVREPPGTAFGLALERARHGFGLALVRARHEVRPGSGTRSARRSAWRWNPRGGARSGCGNSARVASSAR